MVTEVPLDTVPTGRSDLLSLHYQNEAASRGVWRSRGEWIPRLNAFGVTEWHDEDIFGTNKNHWTVGVLLEWSVFDGLGQWGRKNQANALAAATRIRYRRSGRNLPASTSSLSRRLVATRIRTSIFLGSEAPRGVISRSSSTRSRLACTLVDTPEISSRTS